MNELKRTDRFRKTSNSKSINSCLITVGVPYYECYVGSTKVNKTPYSAQSRSVYTSMTLDEIANLSEYYYKKSVQEWHPDKNQDRYELATKMTQEINSAYDRIKVILERRGYVK